MRIVLHLSDLGWTIAPEQLPRLLGDVAELAEAGGYDGIAVGELMDEITRFLQQWTDAERAGDTGVRHLCLAEGRGRHLVRLTLLPVVDPGDAGLGVLGMA